MATLSINDFLTINGEVVGVLKSRKLNYINAPTARDGQTSVFYKVDYANKKYGEAFELDMPAMIVCKKGMTSIVNPAVVAAIKGLLT